MSDRRRRRPEFKPISSHYTDFRRETTDPGVSDDPSAREILEGAQQALNPQPPPVSPPSLDSPPTYSTSTPEPTSSAWSRRPWQQKRDYANDTESSSRYKHHENYDHLHHISGQEKEEEVNEKGREKENESKNEKALTARPWTLDRAFHTIKAFVCFTVGLRLGFYWSSKMRKYTIARLLSPTVVYASGIASGIAITWIKARDEYCRYPSLLWVMSGFALAVTKEMSSQSLYHPSLSLPSTTPSSSSPSVPLSLNKKSIVRVAPKNGSTSAPSTSFFLPSSYVPSKASR